MNILGWVDWTVEKVETPDDASYLIFARPSEPPARCPHCGFPPGTARWGRREQDYGDTPIHDRTVTIRVARQRYKCEGCNTVFLEPLPEMDDDLQLTRRLVRRIEALGGKRTFVSLAADLGIDHERVKRVFMRYAIETEASTTVATPTVLGIDEVHLRKRARGVLTNVGARQIYDLLPKATQEVFERRLLLIPAHERARVKIVTMDIDRKSVV